MTAGTLLMLPALALVIGLIWLSGHAVRRGWLRLPAAPAANARLALLQTLAIDSRRRLHLVRCDDRLVLLLTGGANDALLGGPPDRPEPH
jgi:flagellar protein FliO/FliZ